MNLSQTLELNQEAIDSNIKVGDLILLTAFSYIPQGAKYSGVISADGVISKSVSLIPKEGEHGANVQTRSCLFRVENARKFERHEEETDSELMMAIGKSLTYGERIQLRHWHSKGFLSIDRHNIAMEAGCLEINISDAGNEDTWFEILPVNKLRNAGEVIKYVDSFYLKSSYEKSAYFLHFNAIDLETFDSKAEVNACGKPYNWRMKKYMSFDLTITSGSYVTTGDSFRIVHKISEGYLCAEETPIFTDPDFYEAASEVETKVFVLKGNKSSNSLWELQRIKTFVGGIARWNEKFRIKHLATGKFLAKHKSGLVLKNKAEDSEDEFELLPQMNNPEDEVRFGVVFSITNANELLKIEFNKEAIGKGEKLKNSHVLSFVDTKKDYSLVAFVLEDVLESSTAHVYKLSMMGPKLQDAYFYIKNCDINQKTLVENPEKELILRQTCKNLLAMFANVRKFVIYSTSTEVDGIKRQDAMRELGVIDALLKIADVIQFKIMSSSVLPLLDKEVSKFSHRSGNDENIGIAYSHLNPLEKEVYELIYEAVKNNPKNCQCLLEYEDNIMQMLTSQHFYVIGKILREMFKHVVELSKYSERRIDKWFNNLQQLKLATPNMKKQGMYLEMIKYLFQVNGNASLAYQAQFKDKLLKPGTMKFIKMHIIRGKPCIELDYNRSDETLGQILSINDYLASLKLVKADELIDLYEDSAIFYIEDLCQNNDYSKYVAAAIDFYTFICFDRYNSAIDLVKREINARPEFIILALNYNLDLKLKASLIDFLTIVFIDIDPFVPTTKYKSRCFAWENSSSSKGLELIDKNKIPLTEYLFEVGQIVDEFWNSSQTIELKSLGGLIKMVTSYLKLTKALLDLEILKLDFLDQFMIIVLYLIMTTDEHYGHWCHQLVRTARETLVVHYKRSLGAGLSEMLEEVMDLLFIIIIKRENLHVEDMAKLFFRLKTMNEDKTQGFQMDFKATKEMRFESVLCKLEWKSDIGGVSHHLDIHLLNLLFNSDKNVSREVRKKALELILADMNMRNTLKQELATVEFLVNQVDKDFYLLISSFASDLNNLVKELMTMQIEKASNELTLNKSKETSKKISELIQIIEDENNTAFKKNQFQTMMRLAAIYKPLIQIFQLDSYTHLNLIKSSSNLLFIFVNRNQINQELLLPHHDLFLQKIGTVNSITKLLAEILNRSSKLKKSNHNMIRFISNSINSSGYEFRLIQLMRTFVYDENREVIPKMQVDVLKWIFKNESIKFMHFQTTGHYAYLEPKFPDPSDVNYANALKFHCEVMKTINLCAYKNTFGIMQGRKLITILSLLKSLKRKNLNRHFKKTYLRFLYEVYMPHNDEVITQSIMLNELKDIFQDVFLPDIDEAISCINIIVSTASKGFYENIVCKKVTNLKYLTFMNLVSSSKSVNPMESPKSLKEIKLNDGEKEALEIWRYLSGGQSWHTEKDGLLHIMRDMLHHGIAHNEMILVVNEINKKLKIISKHFEELQRQNTSLDFSNIIMIVNSCREAADKQGKQEDDYEQLDEKVAALVVSLRDTIIERKMSLEEMFAFFDSDKSGSISRTEFKTGIRCLLNCPYSSLDICFNYFSSNKETLFISDFTEKLRKYFFNRVQTLQRKEPGKKLLTKLMVMPEGYQETSEILQDYKIFCNKFGELCKDQDLNELVMKIKNFFVDPAIKKNDFTVLKEFVTKLGTAFKKKVHKIYLLQILKLLIPSDLVLDEVFDSHNVEKAAKLESIRKTQEILSISGVIELALTIISSEHEIELVDEAVQLLINLLRYGNRKVQERFLEILKSSHNSYLFSYIRLRLRQSRDRIVFRAKLIYEKTPEKALQGRVPNEELEQNMIFQECLLESKTSQKKTLHVKRLVYLLQLLSENCYSEFQHYIRSQDTYSLGDKGISINIVNELAQYLINIKEVGPELINDDEATQIIPQCFETLIYLCRGPCLENQVLLGLKRKLYKFVDNLIQGKVAESLFFDCSIRFLKVLLEGETNKDIAAVMIEEINFEVLAQEAVNIYKEKIFAFREYIIRENIGDENPWRFFGNLNSVPQLDIFDWKRVNSGFDIVIIFLKLRQKFPDSAKLRPLSFKKAEGQSDADHVKSILENLQGLGGRQESLLRGIKLLFRSFWKKPEIVDENRAFQFYFSLIASVEIDRDGYLEQSFFRVPGMILFLSNDMRYKMLYELNRNSHEEKVKSFFQKSELCQIHMHHLQQLSKYKILTWWASKSKSLATLSFFIIVLINLILLFSISSASDSNFNIGLFPGLAFLSLFGVIVIILSLAVYFLFLVENIPIILYDHFNKPKDTDIYRLPAANKLRGTVVVKYYAESSSHLKHASDQLRFLRFIYVIFYKDNFYNLVYIVLVCIAWRTVFVYPFLLLDIVRRNENLRYILRAVTQNRKQLGLTVLLGLIFVYLFGVVGFLVFYDQYEDENGEHYCFNLISCVGFTLYYGVRAGGGIGDNLKSVSKDNSLYNLMQAFNLLFFIIVIIILLNIIFGIIIDTFGELRDKRKKIEEDINNICNICGKEKFEFELRGSGWKEHTQIEHNLFAYLAYIVYIKRKPADECDGLEKYVKQKIGDGDVCFLPKNAMCLIRGDQEEQNNLLKEIDLGIKDVEGVISRMNYNKDFY